MGRPLKIRKYNNDGVNGNQVDYGYPNNGTTNNGFNGNYPGIVGGTQQDSDQIRCQVCILVKGIGTITTATNSTTVTGVGTHFTTDAWNATNGALYVSDGNGGYTLVGGYSSTTSNTAIELDANAAVAVSGSAWFYTVVSNNGSIIRQKATRKYMVTAMGANIQDESIAQGQAYLIVNVSNTDWQALGAGPNASVGDIFTALKSGAGLATGGTVVPVSTCVLVNQTTPTAPNTMSVYINDDGTIYNASRLKDHFSTNFATPYANCNPGTEFIATFFNNSGDIDPASGKAYTSTENWC